MIKKIQILSFAFCCLMQQSAHAQITSLGGNDDGGNESVKGIHFKFDNPNASFKKHIPEPVNGVYKISGKTTGMISDPNSYQGKLIPHFDMGGYMGFLMPLEYAYSGAAAGQPTNPSFVSDLSISKTAITFKLTDKNIFIASGFDENGDAVRPKDPFTLIWGCTAGTRTYNLGIQLGNGFIIDTKPSYTCTHSSQVLPRTGRAPGQDEAVATSKASVRVTTGGLKVRTANADYFPPVNFTHTQTITYSISQMAQLCGLTDKEMAAMIVLYGIKTIPLNKTNCAWRLKDTDSDIISYCLYKLYNLDDATITATEQKMKDKLQEKLNANNSDLDKLYAIKDFKNVNGAELLALAKPIAERCKKAAFDTTDRDQLDKAATQYANAHAYVVLAYALQNNMQEASKQFVDGANLFQGLPYLQRFYKILVSEKLTLAKKWDMAAFCSADMFRDLSASPAQKKELTDTAKVTRIMSDRIRQNFGFMMLNAHAACRAGEKRSRDMVLDAYRNFADAPFILNNYNYSMAACELLFYQVIDEMREMLDEKPINRETAFYAGRLDGRAERFYGNYQLALQAYNTYVELYKKDNNGKPIEESVGLKCMDKYMKENFYRTSEEKAFDEEMLKGDHRSDHTMVPVFIPAEELYKLGVKAADEKSYSEAFTLYQKAAWQGHAFAQCNLGDLYQNGPIGYRNYEKALFWYHKAADQGDAFAQYNLGYTYLKGIGVTEDRDQAISWFRKAAEKGNENALKVLQVLQPGVKITVNKPATSTQPAASNTTPTAPSASSTTTTKPAAPKKEVNWVLPAYNEADFEKHYAEAMKQYDRSKDFMFVVETNRTLEQNDWYDSYRDVPEPTNYPTPIGHVNSIIVIDGKNYNKKDTVDIECALSVKGKHVVLQKMLQTDETLYSFSDLYGMSIEIETPMTIHEAHIPECVNVIRSITGNEYINYYFYSLKAPKLDSKSSLLKCNHSWKANCDMQDLPNHRRLVIHTLPDAKGYDSIIKYKDKKQPRFTVEIKADIK